MNTQTEKKTTNREHQLTELPRATNTGGGLASTPPMVPTIRQARPACAHPFLINGIKRMDQNWMDLTEIYERGLI